MRGTGWYFFGPDDSDAAIVSRDIVTEIGFDQEQCGLVIFRTPKDFTMAGVHSVMSRLSALEYGPVLVVEDICRMVTYKTSHGKVAHIAFDTDE
jgi:hypothetical protein